MLSVPFQSAERQVGYRPFRQPLAKLVRTQFAESDLDCIHRLCIRRGIGLSCRDVPGQDDHRGAGEIARQEMATGLTVGLIHEHESRLFHQRDQSR